MADPNPPDANNHRVTLAEIKRDVAHILETLGAIREETEKWRTAVDGRLHYLEMECQTSKADLARLDERQKANTGALGVLIAVGSAIAAAVGSFVK